METWREAEDAAFACEGRSQFLMNLELHGGQKQMHVSLKVHSALTANISLVLCDKAHLAPSSLSCCPLHSAAWL